ncbi:MAG: hypothetical protein ACK4K4_06390, partial [Caldimicrobium sp.]
ELQNLGLKLKDFQLSLGFTGEGRNFYGREEAQQRKPKFKKIEDLFINNLEGVPTYFHQGSLYKIA